MKEHYVIRVDLKESDFDLKHGYVGIDYDSDILDAYCLANNAK